MRSKQGTIAYNDSVYTILGIEAACVKAVPIYIEPDEKYADDHFDQTLYREAWISERRQPIVTTREGKYVFIYRPDGLKTDKGFKALLVSKYAMAKAKYVEPVVEETPAFNDEPRWNNNDRYGDRRPTGGRPQNRNYGGGGYNPNFRRYNDR